MSYRVALVAGLCAMATAGAGIGAQAPKLPTVDQIVDKYVASVGGKASEKVTSLQGRGTVKIAEAGLAGTIEVLQKTPDKQVTIVDIAGFGQQKEGYDGVVAWVTDPQTGLREKSGGELADVKRSSMFPRELKMKQIYPKMTVKGQEKVGTRDTWVVVGEPADGLPARLYFDVETGLPIRQVVTRQSPAGPMEVDVRFDDYRVVDGVKRPFSIHQITAQFTVVIEFTEVKHNVPIDDAVFRKPSSN
jgi:hypothetical protein